jgi:hypothetical protein
LEPFNKSVVEPILKLFKKKQKIELVGKLIKRYSPNYVIVEPISGVLNFAFGDLLIIDNYNIDVSKEEFTVCMLTVILSAEDKLYLELYLLDNKINDVNSQVSVFRPTNEIQKIIEKQLENNVIYKRKDDIIGKINKDSDIDIVKIKMLPDVDNRKKLEEGDLVSTIIYGKSVKYQIINVETQEESIDVHNKSGFKIITGQQIGYWEEDKKKFKDINWVPDPNSLLQTEENEEVQNYGLDSHCFMVGVVPKSRYPIFLDLNEAVNHHIAILGRTGSGKSLMASKLIKQMVENDYTVVILEVDQENEQSLSKYIKREIPDKISGEITTWAVDKKKPEWEQWSCELNLTASDGKKVFIIDWDKNIKNSNTGPVIVSDGVTAVIKEVITYHLANPTVKICIVMEEAYDFIPESTFGSQKFGQPNVSRISQLVLKCRKNNIGFLIITQRTALVTKTILYSCNSIIALQSFDETSKTFMSAYIDSRYLESMSILPRFRAIVVGKGSSCDKPVIVDFEDKTLSQLSVVQAP